MCLITSLVLELCVRKPDSNRTEGGFQQAEALLGDSSIQYAVAAGGFQKKTDSIQISSALSSTCRFRRQATPLLYIYIIYTLWVRIWDFS